MKRILPALIVASCAATPHAAPPPAPPSPPVSAPRQAPTDAEAQYQKMEKALAAAKKVRLEFESATDGATVKGTFALAEGNILEMKISGLSGTKKYSLVLACDGKKMNLKRDETPAPPVPLGDQPELDAPANLAANVALALARGGAWLAQEVADREYRAVADPFFNERQKARDEGRAPKPPTPVPPGDAAALHTLGNFKSGSGGSVSYDLTPKAAAPPVAITLTVWIDSKTGLPTKREGRFFATTDGKPAGPALSTWTETYKFN